MRHRHFVCCNPGDWSLDLVQVVVVGMRLFLTMTFCSACRISRFTALENNSSVGRDAQLYMRLQCYPNQFSAQSSLLKF
jgi:hypothetical protein